MKNKTVKKMTSLLVTIMAALVVLGGCSKPGDGAAEDNISESSTEGNDTGNESTDLAQDGAEGENVTELEVRFGDDGEPFVLHLNDNDTAAAIARHVGTSDWRLPIYEADADADYDVLQYYDIPDRYEIPANSESVTSVKAGEVYYSEPNRIVLFYHDAEVEEEYTPVGSFEATDEFITAVEENPVLEGWDSKIIRITR